MVPFATWDPMSSNCLPILGGIGTTGIDLVVRHDFRFYQRPSWE